MKCPHCKSDDIQETYPNLSTHTIQSGWYCNWCGWWWKKDLTPREREET